MTKHEHEEREATKSCHIKSQGSGDFIQKKIFRSMTPAQKLDLAIQLYYSAKELKEAGLRAQHPNWTEKKIEEKVREIFLYAR